MSNSSNQSLLKNVYLFKELNSSELDSIASIAKVKTFNSGDEIFSETDKADSLYVIRLGSVRIKRSGKEDAIEVAQLGSGSHFGEMSFVDGEPRSASVVANEKTELVSIDFSALNQILDKNPTIAVKVYRSLSHFLCGRLRLTTVDLTFAREKNIRHF